MPNMSYCMFENTYADLQVCLDKLAHGDDLSESEEKYRKLLIELCQEIAQDYGDLDN